MDIKLIAGYAVITKNCDESAKFYRDDLGLPLVGKEEYLSMDRFPGSKHFGIWPLHMAAESCFGSKDWPENIPQPTSTIEYEVGSPIAVASAVSVVRVAFVGCFRRPVVLRLIRLSYFRARSFFTELITQ